MCKYLNGPLRIGLNLLPFQCPGGSGQRYTCEWDFHLELLPSFHCDVTHTLQVQPGTIWKMIKITEDSQTERPAQKQGKVNAAQVVVLVTGYFHNCKYHYRSDFRGMSMLEK